MTGRVVVGEFEIDCDRQVALRRGRRLHLTGQEWAVIAVLAARAGRTASKPDLVSALAGATCLNAVEFHISRLRRKLGAEAIETIRGAGYRLKARTEPRAAG